MSVHREGKFDTIYIIRVPPTPNYTNILKLYKRKTSHWKIFEIYQKHWPQIKQEGFEEMDSKPKDINVYKLQM